MIYLTLRDFKVKEEKLAPVEVERAMEGLKEEYRQEGRLEGRIEGRQEGELKILISLLRQGIISEEVVLKNLNINKEELEKKIKELAI